MFNILWYCMIKIPFQAIFYWNLVARNVARAFELNPGLQPSQLTYRQTGQTIQLSDAQVNEPLWLSVSILFQFAEFYEALWRVWLQADGTVERNFWPFWHWWRGYNRPQRGVLLHCYMFTTSQDKNISWYTISPATNLFLLTRRQTMTPMTNVQLDFAMVALGFHKMPVCGRTQSRRSLQSRPAGSQSMLHVIVDDGTVIPLVRLRRAKMHCVEVLSSLNLIWFYLSDVVLITWLFI